MSSSYRLFSFFLATFHRNVIFDTKDPDSDITLIDFGLSTKYIKSPGHDKLTDKVGTMYSISPQVLQGAYNEKVSYQTTRRDEQK
jgi:serine/threonine protein kinase